MINRGDNINIRLTTSKCNHNCRCISASYDLNSSQKRKCYCICVYGIFADSIRLINCTFSDKFYYEFKHGKCESICVSCVCTWFSLHDDCSSQNSNCSYQELVLFSFNFYFLSIQNKSDKIRISKLFHNWSGDITLVSSCLVPAYTDREFSLIFFPFRQYHILVNLVFILSTWITQCLLIHVYNISTWIQQPTQDRRKEWK